MYLFLLKICPDYIQKGIFSKRVLEFFGEKKRSSVRAFFGGFLG